jgi:4-hydroxybenzoate polyprenyltransferase
MIALSNEILVVDLDGTLLKSDMLHECFWFDFGRNWHGPFLSMIALLRGKAAFKAHLSYVSKIDISTLPYDNQVISYIRNHRDNGGRTALVTASHQALAVQIAKHLQLFDEVHGSDDLHNLKGSSKAEFLINLFGRNSFNYMGDAHADMPVWEASKKVITVNAAQSVCQKAERLGKPFEHLVTTTKSMRPYMKALRPHQWLKNILIFLPMLASHQFNAQIFISTLLAFVAFSFVASSVYVLNDLLDLNADRAHPSKRFRPFAYGAVPIAHGTGMALALLLGGTLVAAFLDWTFLLVLGAYYIFTTAYSLTLKRKIVLDICVLAGLYTLRIIAGGVASGIELSVWLLAFSIFFFLSLAAVKRQSELVDMSKRGVSMARGRGYHVEDLPIISMIGLAAGYISVLVMALYVNSSNVQALYNFPYALWGICSVLIYWLTRMVIITHRGFMHDDPVVFAAKDKVSLACFVVMFGFVAIGVLF